MSKLRLSASRVNVYNQCHKKYYWIYIKNLIPIGPPGKALQIGSLVHRLKEMLHKGEDFGSVLRTAPAFTEWVKTEYDDPSNLAEVAYDAYRLFKKLLEVMQEKDLSFESSETHMELDLGDFLVYTRLDGVVRTPDDRLWRDELKTTSRLDSAYLSGLKGGLQAGMAHLVTKNVYPEPLSGTLYTLLVKTKEAQCHVMPIPKERHIEEMTLRCLEGTYKGITDEVWYPSMNCFTYNRSCEYLPLCKHPSEKTKQDFYTERKEVVFGEVVETETVE